MNYTTLVLSLALAVILLVLFIWQAMPKAVWIILVVVASVVAVTLMWHVTGIGAPLVVR